ncbi:MAG: polymorphic toxin-type HINT domain-containing protein [Ardenticatenaceae bacterium]|nr:polymorphic toxin-type HINT domain-containing protein [Ardenticatenaceae bacterium]
MNLSVAALSAQGGNSGIGSQNGSDGQSLTCFVRDLAQMIAQIQAASQEASREVGLMIEALLEAARDPAKWRDAAAEAQDHLANLTKVVKDSAVEIKDFALRNKWVVGKSLKTLGEILAVPLEIAVQVGIAFTPFDEAYDGLSLFLGYDLISGEKLSDFEMKLIIGGLVAGLIFGALDAVFAAARGLDNLARNVDDVIGTMDEYATVGAKSLDDLGTIGVKSTDEFASVGRKTAADVPGAARRSDLNDDIRPRSTSDHTVSNCVTDNSFTAGTMILTAEGPVPIEKIDIGDTVLAEDPDSGEQAYQEVVSLTDHPEDELVYITIQSVKMMMPPFWR